MNFFRLILLLSLSFGIGLHSATVESMTEHEVPEPKEIVDSSFVLTQSDRERKKTAQVESCTFFNQNISTKCDLPSTPALPIKRHLWVMQFLL